MADPPILSRPGSFSAADARFMRRALRLAERGFTTPNPRVGCVIVRDGRIVGEGFHPRAGEPHAEVFALRDAGERARGATVYVTLEPCSHFGRTPPCSRALIDAGPARVVAATGDPNPRVSGGGFEALRRAGIAVEIGLLRAEAERVNEAFFHFHRTGRPFVTLKAAMTLDGKIATRTGDSRWITGERARAFVHRERAQSGAILCGIGTVLADDPLLTARVAGRDLRAGRQPLRIVLDSLLRIPLDSKIVRTAYEVPTLVACGAEAPGHQAKILQDYGVEILRLAAEDGEQKGPIGLEPLFEELGRREIISVLVEGGGQVHAAMLAGSFAHRILWFIAPKLIGGKDAPTPVEGAGVAAMSEAVTLTGVRTRRVGVDLLVEGYPAGHTR